MEGINSVGLVGETKNGGVVRGGFARSRRG